MLNVVQKIILVIGAAVVVGLALFPPWVYTLNTDSIHREKPAGYHYIGSPPAPEHDRPMFGVRADWPRAALPMTAVVFATLAGVWIAAQPKK